MWKAAQEADAWEWQRVRTHPIELVQSIRTAEPSLSNSLLLQHDVYLHKGPMNSGTCGDGVPCRCANIEQPHLCLYRYRHAPLDSQCQAIAKAVRAKQRVNRSLLNVMD